MVVCLLQHRCEYFKVRHDVNRCKHLYSSEMVKILTILAKRIARKVGVNQE